MTKKDDEYEALLKECGIEEPSSGIDISIEESAPIIGQAVNFNDLSDIQKQNAMYAMYVDFAFCDPLPLDDNIICPTQPLPPNAKGLPVVFYKGKDVASIDDFVVGTVTEQIDQEVEIKVDDLSYVTKVWHGAVLQ